MTAHHARSLEFSAPRTVRVRDLEVQEPEEGEVLVKTVWSGISGGTEMLAWRGEIDPATPLDETLGAFAGTFAYPFSYGYACVGRVVRSQGEVREGSLVLVYHPHQDLVVGAERDVVVVDGADPRTATLLPLVETALQACLDAGAVQEQPVVVIGLGCVGILTGALLRRAGAHVTGCDPLADRRRAAEAFGIEAVGPAQLGSLAGPVPLVVEASGRPEALASSLDLLAHEGTALVVSWYGTKPVPLPLGGAFHRRRLKIRSSQVSTIPARLSGRWTVTRRRAVARALLDELPVKTLATHDFAFDEAQRAYEQVNRGEPGLLHAALRYEGS